MRPALRTLAVVCMLAILGLRTLAAQDAAASLIAFTSDRDGNKEIYVMNADGSDPRNLTNNAANDDQAAWSPDGTQIVFASERNASSAGYSDLYIMNADGSNVRRITKAFWNETDPAWSPDGTQIAYMSNENNNQDIFVMNVDGSDIRKLTEDQHEDTQPAWSPDGTQIVYSSYLGAMMINADGSNPVRFPADMLAQAVNIVWSPDGSTFGFSGREFSTSQIFSVPVTGGTWTNLSNNDAANDDAPAWSPDGSQIVFESVTGDVHNLYLMNSDGSDTHALTDTGHDRSPAWQPMAGFQVSAATAIPAIQADLSQTYVEPNGSYQFNYPVEWVPDTNEFDGKAFMSLGRMYIQVVVGADEIAFSFTSIGFPVSSEALSLKDGPHGALENMFKELYGSQFDQLNIQIEDTTLGGHPAAYRANRGGTYNDSVDVIVDLGNGTPGYITASLDPGTLDQYQQLVLDIAASLRLEGQAENVTGEATATLPAPTSTLQAAGVAATPVPAVMAPSTRVAAAPVAATASPTLASVPQASATPSVVPTPVSCPGLLPSRMIKGQFGIVLPGDANNMRTSPNRSAPKNGAIPAGDTFEVLDGPVCADGYAWWQVNYNGVIGWTAEAGGGDYWIEPFDEGYVF